MNKKIFILLIVFPWMLSSCLRDKINPDVVDVGTVMVLNGIINPDEQVRLELTTATSVNNQELPSLIKDADIILSANNQDYALSFDAFEEAYMSNGVSLAAGDPITVVARHPDFVTLRNNTFIPESFQVSGQLIEDGGTDTSGFLSDLLTLTFTDKPVEKNFYEVRFEYYNVGLGEYLPMYFRTSDPSLAEYNSFRINDQSVVFSDELFDGQTKSLSNVASFGLVDGNPDEKYRIVLSIISEDLFLYYRSLIRAEEAQGATFEAGYNNAVVIHSNVTGGLGIVGTKLTKYLELK